MTTTEGPTPVTRSDAFERLPGLYQHWEVPRVLPTAHALHTEEAGPATNETQLFAIYRRRDFNEETINE